jgi:prolyl-tRNA synthetase
VAPYEVVITVVKVSDDESMRVADELYAELRNSGVDVLLDDRDERPGVKFADAELVGIPFRITLGPKGLATGMAELTPRATRESVDVPVTEVAAHVTELVRTARRSVA